MPRTPAADNADRPPRQPKLGRYAPDFKRVPLMQPVEELHLRADRAQAALKAAGYDSLIGELRQGIRRGEHLADGRALWCQTVMAAERAAAELTGTPACPRCHRLTDPNTDSALCSICATHTT